MDEQQQRPASAPRRIQVTGDLILDRNLVQVPGLPTAYFEPLPKAILHERLGGAWYLRDMIELICPRVGFSVTSPPPPVNLAPDCAAHAYTVWSPYPRSNRSRERVWRISEFLGCHPAANPGPAASDLNEEPDVLVLDDLNLGFNRSPEAWPRQALASPRTEIVLKTSPPLAQDPLWERLATHHANRLTVVLSVSALRSRNAAISRSLSWDHAVEDLQREFRTGVSSRDLGRCKRVVVHFGPAGLAVFHQGDSGCELERLVYHPVELEGMCLAAHPGLTFGAASLVAASFARHAADPQSYPLFVAAGRALAAIRTAHEIGAGPVRDEPTLGVLRRFDTDAAHSALGSIFQPEKTDPQATAEAAYRTSLGTARKCFRGVTVTNGRSNLLEDLTGPGLESVAAKAFQVVLSGVPKALSSAPRAQYGAYGTVDREEIERINELRGLISSYSASQAESRPLSIAVFGPPGSGKSFAIKQLARELFPNGRAELEFNLSQMESRADLHSAFHQVRDATVLGQIPLVFWDEFDADDLRWLPEFLAPMQDSAFRAGSVAHPFGKAIFIFGGGTRANFQAFDRSSAGGEVEDHFRMRKGPDFVSRLRGYVNIKGPNSTGPADVAHLLRRAVLLRSVLERNFPRLIDPGTREAAVSAGVIRGFLRAKGFLHGARSLEAIVMMSALEQARHFGVHTLPSPDLLALHVTPDFVEEVRAGELEQPVPRLVELLAMAGHRGWSHAKAALGYAPGSVRSDEPGALTHPDLVGWDELPEARKDANREPIPRRVLALWQLGYRIQPLPLDGAVGARPTLSREDVERLVEAEHELWLREHLVHGWEWGPDNDDARRIHRDICPFASLAEEQKDLNRAIVTALPETLTDAGYMLHKGLTVGARLRVGVTGHRILTDLNPLREGVRAACQRVRDAYGGIPITLLSSLAEGADRLAADIILSGDGNELEAVLPFEPESFAEDFGVEGSPSRLHFQALLERSTRVTVIPDAGSRNAGYAEAGREVLRRCDVLLAIWDGQPAQGAGGTGEIVAAAREAGKPVIVVRAGNRIPGTLTGTTLGPEQGCVIAERLPGETPQRPEEAAVL